MNLAVFLLCALTSLFCAVLLLRAYLRDGVRLLLWSGLCFLCFAFANAMVIADYRLVLTYDLGLLRVLPTLLGIGFLLYGLIWESE